MKRTLMMVMNESLEMMNDKLEMAEPKKTGRIRTADNDAAVVRKRCLNKTLALNGWLLRISIKQTHLIISPWLPSVGRRHLNATPYPPRAPMPPRWAKGKGEEKAREGLSTSISAGWREDCKSASPTGWMNPPLNRRLFQEPESVKAAREKKGARLWGSGSQRSWSRLPYGY